MSAIEDDSEPVMDRYRRSLGTFIHDFTILELCVFRLLCVLAGVPEEIGQALFSGTRADTMVGFIRRCYQARALEVPAFVERALTQTKVLSNARNDVVHLATFEIEDNEDAVIATNRFRYLPAQARDMHIEPKRLDEMASDARIIPAMLAVAGFEIAEQDCPPGLSAAMREPQPPWHYKPPSQDKSRR